MLGSLFDSFLNRDERTGSVLPVRRPRTGRIIAFFPLVPLCIVEESTVRQLDPEGLPFFKVNTHAGHATLRAKGRPYG